MKTIVALLAALGLAVGAQAAGVSGYTVNNYYTLAVSSGYLPTSGGSMEGTIVLDCSTCNITGQGSITTSSSVTAAEVGASTVDAAEVDATDVSADTVEGDTITALSLFQTSGTVQADTLNMQSPYSGSGPSPYPYISLSPWPDYQGQSGIIEYPASPDMYGERGAMYLFANIQNNNTPAFISLGHGMSLYGDQGLDSVVLMQSFGSPGISIGVNDFSTSTADNGPLYLATQSGPMYIQAGDVLNVHAGNGVNINAGYPPSGPNPITMQSPVRMGWEIISTDCLGATGCVADCTSDGEGQKYLLGGGCELPLGGATLLSTGPNGYSEWSCTTYGTAPQLVAYAICAHMLP
jgi:hypothetical protein